MVLNTQLMTKMRMCFCKITWTTYQCTHRRVRVHTGKNISFLNNQIIKKRLQKGLHVWQSYD